VSVLAAASAATRNITGAGANPPARPFGRMAEILLNQQLWIIRAVSRAKRMWLGSKNFGLPKITEL
jgi:hypothetical protein